MTEQSFLMPGCCHRRRLRARRGRRRAPNNPVGRGENQTEMPTRIAGQDRS
jgi:hypothetical protein